MLVAQYGHTLADRDFALIAIFIIIVKETFTDSLTFDLYSGFLQIINIHMRGVNLLNLAYIHAYVPVHAKFNIYITSMNNINLTSTTYN